MENAIRDFIRISKYAGMRNDLAQAGGGNTSVKLDDRVMLVKSSGFQLADVSENSGYSKIDYRLVVEYFQKNVREAGEAAQGTEVENAFTEETGKKLLQEAQMEGGRASIETFLHAITGKYTLHSHPALVNILTARVGGMDTLHTMFPEAVLVPYRKPGAALAEAYYKAAGPGSGRIGNLSGKSRAGGERRFGGSGDWLHGGNIAKDCGLFAVFL